MSKQLGSMQLTWTKLGKYNNEADIYLCDQIVAFRRFDQSSNEWTVSELRQWLNGEFYRQVFTDEQRKQIVSNEITQDHVFLLSIKEFEKYERLIIGAYYYWWLRSPSNIMCRTAIVSDNSNIIFTGYRVYSVYGVRPAILLRNT